MDYYLLGGNPVRPQRLPPTRHLRRGTGLRIICPPSEPISVNPDAKPRAMVCSVNIIDSRSLSSYFTTRWKSCNPIIRPIRAIVSRLWPRRKSEADTLRWTPARTQNLVGDQILKRLILHNDAWPRRARRSSHRHFVYLSKWQSHILNQPPSLPPALPTRGSSKKRPRAQPHSR